MAMIRTPTACLIIIGNEILSGRTQDKNLSWLAENLNLVGVKMVHARVIPDIEETIVSTVNECRAIYDYVFTTGGIGPTHDDITSACIAKAFGVPLLRHPEAERRLREHYDADTLNEARLRMANIPEGGILIDNPVSVAPGFQMENVFVMAGVPSIMQAMFDHLKERLTGGATTLSRSISVYLPEGTIAEGLADIQAQFPDVDIGSYPMIKDRILSTSLVFRSTDEPRLEQCFSAAQEMLATLNADIISSD